MNPQITRGFLNLPLLIVLGFTTYSDFKAHMQEDGFFAKETAENQETEFQSIWAEAQSRKGELNPPQGPEQPVHAAPPAPTTPAAPATAGPSAKGEKDVKQQP